jgi:putative transposase
MFLFTVGRHTWDILKWITPTMSENKNEGGWIVIGEVDPKNWTTRDVKLIEGHCCVPRFLMANTRQKRHPAAFKPKVALEAVKQTRSLADLSRTFQVHPVRISQWKKQLLDGVESLFSDGRRRKHDESLAPQAQLYEQIGRLNMEVEWLKKKLPAGADLKRPLVEPDNPALSIRRQCELLGLNRTSHYLVPATASEEDLRLMRLIDQQFLRTPFYGSRRMAVYLERAGETVNRKRVQRLMAVMGPEALFPRPRTTTAAPGARAYPYLLRDRELNHADEVWSSDITYVLMRHGFM